MEALGVLYGLSHNTAYVYKPMFNGLILFLYVLYIQFGVFLTCRWMEQYFYLMLNENKPKWSLLSFFHICLLLYHYTTYENYRNL